MIHIQISSLVTKCSDYWCVYGAFSPTVFNNLCPLDWILVYPLLHSSITDCSTALCFTEICVTALQSIALHWTKTWVAHKLIAYSFYRHITHRKGLRMFPSDPVLSCELMNFLHIPEGGSRCFSRTRGTCRPGNIVSPHSVTMILQSNCDECGGMR
jgi:hypothetical protein